MDVQHPPRTAGRWPYAVGALSALAVVAMLLAAWRVTQPVWTWNVAFTSAALASMGGMLAARRGALPGQRDQWTWWVGAAGLWLVGQLFWDLFSAVGFPASPNVADACWFGY